MLLIVFVFVFCLKISRLILALYAAIFYRPVLMHKFIIIKKRGEKVKLSYLAMLYTHSIGNQPYNTMVVFKMSDSVPSVRYSSVCNVLRLWSLNRFNRGRSPRNH